MELSSLARLTHSRHFDTVKHGEDGLAIPAGLIVALATSLSARDLHEVCKRNVACLVGVSLSGMRRWCTPGLSGKC